MIQSMKAAGLSLPRISDQLGVSVSTIKRAKATQESRQLQLT